MSEANTSHDSESPPEGKVYDFVKKQNQIEGTLDPSELTNIEAIDLFFAQLRHPAMKGKSSGEVGEFVLAQIGNTSNQNMSTTEITWRSRMMTMLVDVDDIDEGLLDSWLDKDVPLAALYGAMGATKAHAQEMRYERAAMMVLRHLRGGMLHRQETTPANDQQWLEVIEKLSSYDSIET